MDLTLIVVLGIVAANVITFLGGCVIAMRRYRRERADDPANIAGRPATPSKVSPVPAVKRHSDR